MCIHVELLEIRKALKKAIIPTERYRNELWAANKKMHENVWCSKPNDVATGTSFSDTVNISTSTTNLIHFTTNGTDPIDTSASAHRDQQSANGRFDLIGHLRSLNDSDGHKMQIKSIIEDNVNLRIR